MTSTTDPRDRLFALIASIPGSGTVDWCGPARVLLDEIATPSSGRAALLREAAEAVESDSWSRRDRWGRYEREEYEAGMRNAAELLGRMADEAETDGSRVAAEEQPAETQDGAARVASLEQEVKRLGLMVDEYGSGAGALTDKLQRVRDMHRKTCPLVLGGLPVTAFRCGMCELLDAPAPPVVGEQPDTQEADRVVAYVLASKTNLRCLRCAPYPLGDIWTPVTAEELEDGGICSACGVDVLIPQDAAP